METTTKTEQNGVSTSKNDVRNAFQGNGLFPKSFCKIVPDVFGDFAKPLFSRPYVNVMHTSGGSSTINAVAKTLNDIVCSGVTNNILVSSGVLCDEGTEASVVQEIEKYLAHLRSQHINVFSSGNTTECYYEDFLVSITAAARIRQSEIIANDRIQDKDVIIGLASFGQATYETDGLQDEVRNYMPVVKAILENFRPSIHGLVHCPKGQTKCLDFVDEMHIIKDNLFVVSPKLEETKKRLDFSWEEMYKTFDMGHGFEIFTKEKIADDIIKIAQHFGVDAQIIGHCEAAPNKALTIKSKHGTFTY
jgi:phosphoribosylformylglycinamidine cyclo-ligase